MDCKKVSEMIYDYTKAETDEATTAEIRKHLEDCTRCAAELKSTMALKGMFSMAMSEVPVNSIVKIREHLKNPAFFRLFFKPIFAAAALFLIAGTLIINGVVSYNKNVELDRFLDDSYSVVDHSENYDIVTASYTNDAAQYIY